MEKTGELGRLLWKCRRGMLELDVILGGFLEHGYEALTEQQKVLFDQLLEEQDPTLFSWFLTREKPEDQQMAALVQFILDTHQA